MTHNAYGTLQGKKIGDTAVDGLLAGLPAGVGMAIVLMVAGWFGGRAPLATLGYFDPAQGDNWLTGLLAHLAVSAIYGVVFALLIGLLLRVRPTLPRLVVLWGAAYGLVLLAVAYGVWLTAFTSPLAQIPVWQMAAAHIVYGLILGLELDRTQ